MIFIVFKPNFISTQSTQLEVNKSARIARHQRVFAGASSLRLPRFNFGGKEVLNKVASARSLTENLFHHADKSRQNMDPATAANKLFKRYTAMVALLFVAGSISPYSSYADEMNAGEFGAYIDTSSFESGIVADTEGYLTKFNPQTNEGDRSTMNDRFEHTVAPGETLSTIANSYGLKTKTVLWENNLANANSIRVGQTLKIPPVDGVTHTVAKGESLEKIASNYSVETDVIERQNKLISSVVKEGDEIYIPGGQPLVVDTPVRATPARVGTSTRVATTATPVALSGSSDVPASGKPLIFPTRGKITQGYRAGHYAIDIADVSMPPVWAAASGKVVKASSGTWGGGYGNHVVIDHGNGMSTLYAHLDYLSVGLGDVVDQGQVLGKMGRTGRVYGVTGIHLHFEVIKNGVKQVPSNYY